MITNVVFVPAAASEHHPGLIGWVSFVVNDALVLDGVGVRRREAGGLYLQFPERTDRSGRRHPLMRPLDARARAEIERQVLTALPAEALR
jgi:hypothetical protein